MDGGLIVRFSKRLCAGLLAGCLAFSMTGCTSAPSPSKDQDVTAVTVGDTEITFEQARCYIYFTEAIYENVMLQYQMYGMDYGWDSEVSEDSDKTQADSIKDNIIQNIIADEVVYNEAMKTGNYEVTDAELKKIKENAKKLMETMSEDTIDKNGFTEEMFVEYQKKINIVSKYTYDNTKAQEVKREEVEKDIDYEKVYRQYKTEYIKLDLFTTDDKGKTTNFDDKKKEEAKKQMQSVYELVKSGKSMKDAAVVAEGARFNTRDFTVEELENKAEFCVKAAALKVGEFTEVVEFNSAYYIIKLTDDNSKDAYEEAIEVAIDNKKAEKYADAMEELKEKEYKVEINEKVWDSVELGDFAIVADEYEKAFGLLVDKSEVKKTEQ